MWGAEAWYGGTWESGGGEGLDIGLGLWLGLELRLGLVLWLMAR